MFRVPTRFLVTTFLGMTRCGCLRGYFCGLQICLFSKASPLKRFHQQGTKISRRGAEAQSFCAFCDLQICLFSKASPLKRFHQRGTKISRRDGANRQLAWRRAFVLFVICRFEICLFSKEG